VFFVEARYHRSPAKVPQQIKYMSHREEGLHGGECRELFGIGDRYKALRGNEQAIQRGFAEDAKGLRKPVYFRFILTMDDKAAARFARLDGAIAQRVIRDAMDLTFRGADRQVQGVFAVHQHGGPGRAAHPHVHALLSPRLRNGAPTHLSPRAISQIRERWEVEVLRVLERQEQRLQRGRTEPERTPLTPPRFGPARERQARLPFEDRRKRIRPRRRHIGLLTLNFLRARPARKAGKLAGRSVDGALRLFDRAMAMSRDPERVARQSVARVAMLALPQPIREAILITRGIRGLVRQR
jgi:hypothetical protein